MSARVSCKIILTILFCSFFSLVTVSFAATQDPIVDTDGDGVADDHDNCPSVSNQSQGDFDGDGEGDACEDDPDGDGIGSEDDNCPLVPNPDQGDLNGNGTGDPCDPETQNPDVDGDGVLNQDDNCPYKPNPDQADNDGDNWGDPCDNDDDNDDIEDEWDNCPINENTDQADRDGDGVGDVCDGCPDTPNPDQTDADGDGIGDEVPDCAGICGGTDVSCRTQCVYVAAWNNWAGFSPGFGRGPNGYNLEDTLEKFTLTASEGFPGCFADHWASRCGSSSIQQNGAAKLYGLCRADTSSYYGFATSGSLADFLGVPAGHPSRNQNSFRYRSLRLSGQGEHTWFMDDGCNWVEDKGDAEICGFGGVSWSPISLIMDDSVDLEEGMTVVDFSLTGKSRDAYSLWKASDKAPLLVYDPERTGQVRSATQLFGNYTFGGQATRPVSYMSGDTLREPWENGYQPLALLDQNGDEELTGAELEPLSLWFDVNRDAVVDPGELRSVISEGITTLYFKTPKRVGESKDLALNVGYKRVVDGRVVHGRSVDWFAETFTTKQEAIQALGAMFQVSLEDLVGDIGNGSEIKAQPRFESKASGKLPSNPLNFTPHQAKQHGVDLSGYWYWTLKEKGGDRHPGVFAFEQDRTGRVIGFTVVESQVEQNGYGFRSGVAAIPVTGKLVRSREGGLKLKMDASDSKNGGRAHSVAKLTENGTVLVGKTTQNYVIERDGNRKSATITYDWIARKVIAG